MGMCNYSNSNDICDKAWISFRTDSVLLLPAVPRNYLIILFFEKFQFKNFSSHYEIENRDCNYFDVLESLTDIDDSGAGKCVLIKRIDFVTSRYKLTVADCGEDNTFICELGRFFSSLTNCTSPKI